MRFLLVLSVIAAILTFGRLEGAYAHPVSFKRGLGLVSSNSRDMNDTMLAYSFQYNFAAGLTHLKLEQSNFLIPRANFLLKRWNNLGSQGNIYLSGGAGIESRDDSTFDAHLLDFSADWESRKYYVSFEHRYLAREERSVELPKEIVERKFRAGFAPFLADYKDLNVWYILQVRDEKEKDPRPTQFFRFYLNNVLWEIGAGSKEVAFNFMIHI